MAIAVRLPPTLQKAKKGRAVEEADRSSSFGCEECRCRWVQRVAG